MYWVLIISIVISSHCKVKAQKATIRWDQWGIPHIEAKRTKDLYYGLGWAQMKAHGNVILKLYAKARGKSAEYWGGQENVQSDVKIWRLNIPARSKTWYDLQPTEMKEYINAFVSGMNAYAQKYFHLIHPENEAVLPILNTDLLSHLQLSYHVGVGAFALNQQSTSWENAGSNAWAIGPRKSASGNTMLLIQPHPPWMENHRFFEAHLTDDKTNLYGIMQLGSPSMAMGFNENLGWGMTFNQADSFDLIELELQNRKYKLEGNWTDLEISPASIKIREGNSFLDSTVQIKKSAYGHLVSEKKGKALALRLSGLDRPFMMQQLMEMGRAKEVAEFEKALSKLQLPLQNIIFADKKGAIGYVYNGIIPKRPSGNLEQWSQIIPSSRPGALVHSYHSYGELPKIIDPQSGFVANSNNSPWTSTYLPVLEEKDYPPYFAFSNFDLRARKSLRMLLSKDRLTFDDLLEFQGSTKSELAEIVLGELIAFAEQSKDQDLKSAAKVLSHWDKQLDPKSKGAILFIEWYLLVSGDSLFTKEFLWSNLEGFPDGLTTSAKKKLARAVRQTKEKYGSLDVTFDSVFKTQLKDKVLGGALGLNEVGCFSAGFYRPGPEHKKFLVGGTAFSSVIEFGSRLRAKGLLSYGNFTEDPPFEPRDQFEVLLKRQLRDVYFYPKEIRENTKLKELLITE